MIELKNELLRKQQETAALKASGINTITRHKAKPFVKKNAGVEERSKNDETSYEEQDQIAKSRRTLEAKAKLYDKLTSKEILLNDEDCNASLQQKYLIDFEQKAIDSIQRAPTPPDYLTPKNEITFKRELDGYDETETTSFVAPNASGALAADAEHREKMRQKWQQEEIEALERETLDVHYTDVRHDEARTHGAGFYQFDKSESERRRQMEELRTAHAEAEASRVQAAAVKAKRGAMLRERLVKVKRRKLEREGKSADEIEAILAADAAKEAEVLKEEPVKPRVTVDPVVEKAKDDADREALLKKSNKTRAWDLGKNDQWERDVLQKIHDEREPDFAPPTAYHEDNDSSGPGKRRSEQAKATALNQVKANKAFWRKRHASNESDMKETSEIPLPPSQFSSTSRPRFSVSPRSHQLPKTFVSNPQYLSSQQFATSNFSTANQPWNASSYHDVSPTIQQAIYGQTTQSYAPELNAEQKAALQSFQGEFGNNFDGPDISLMAQPSQVNAAVSWQDQQLPSDLNAFHHQLTAEELELKRQTDHIQPAFVPLVSLTSGLAAPVALPRLGIESAGARGMLHVAPRSTTKETPVDTRFVQDG